MWNDIVGFLRDYPQIVLFLALAIGYYIGKIKIFNFSIGSTAGVLIAALVLGQMDITVTPLLKTVAFALFIFTIGYKVGPQFFGALKKEGLKYIWMSIFFAIVGLATAIILAKVFGFDKGTSAGMLAGALTQSSVIGTADGAIKHLASSGAEQVALETNVAIAYAITYVFGTAGLILFFKLVPRLMKINLKEEARKLEQEMSGTTDELEKTPELFSWSGIVLLRAYQVTNADLEGKTVAELKGMFPHDVSVNKLKRGRDVTEVTLETKLKQGDIISVGGNRKVMLSALQIVGPEVEDADVVNVVGEMIKICVTRRDAVGKTLGEIMKGPGHGCFLKKLFREGQDMPTGKNMVIKKCDVLKVTGSQTDVERLIKHLGYAERPTVLTDLVMVGIGCAAGTLLGLIMVPVAGIPITLGIGGGVLVAGLVAGWLRAVHPTFGQIPAGAQWIFTDLGLNLFIACVGLVAGPKALHAIQTAGLSIFFAGAMLTLIPHICGIFFGKYVLKLNPVLLFGSLTGAGTITAALNALKEEADSSLPALGYTVPYAFGNVLLTIWGTVLVYVT
jgi:putative transport protein